MTNYDVEMKERIKEGLELVKTAEMPSILFTVEIMDVKTDKVGFTSTQVRDLQMLSENHPEIKITDEKTLIEQMIKGLEIYSNSLKRLLDN